MKTRLTKPQIAALKLLAKGGCTHTGHSYSDVRCDVRDALVRKGLAEVKQWVPGCSTGNLLWITDAGKAALERALDD